MSFDHTPSRFSADDDYANDDIPEDAEIICLAREDQIRFAQALIDSPKPNDQLARAAKRHAELIEPR